MPATFLEELLQRAQIDSRFFQRGFARSRARHFASHCRDRDQRVVTSTNVGVICDELLIHDDGREFDSQSPTDRHSFTAVARQIDEESLHAVGLHIDVEGRRRLRQLEVDIVAGHVLQHGLQIA